MFLIFLILNVKGEICMEFLKKALADTWNLNNHLF